ncbi:hypothetical protein BKA58DRAFT_354975 [Alternaria rosae]|uniref:uncharacterized protein n=1 Tax=Alternaria rosae TaxID=1187941 RepID=UPI001E8E0EB7|nr:uncharacterized protein BKA58DRAFT_354975 [Alternaria rosae]KAH6878678.1 hypothetical protein BKA58DRAFT_354975 [Alternaria rosae]
MKNDLRQTFGEIFNGDPSAFCKQLLEFQHLKTNRSKAEKWVSNLRFLDVSGIPDLQAEKQKQNRRYALAKARDSFYNREIPLREVSVTKREDDDEDAYIAVSWRWAVLKHEALSGEPEPPVFDYRIRRPHAKPHKSDFPDRYMDRVIQFAQSVNVSKVWIDKECIYQRPGDERKWPKDKELGVQIMDVVYGDSKVSVGLLTVKLEHQHEVDLLSELLQGRIFVDPKDRENPKLRPEVNVLAVQKLIRRILSDPRWDRGWIFQEDHLASNRMTLLIPCSASIQKYRGYDFGDLLGDLKIKLKDLRQNATMFCLARPEERQPNTNILKKLKQYNICNKSYTPLQNEHLLPYRTTTNCVLDDLCNRSLENEEDRIAILANALRFTKRINIGKGSPIHEPGKYSLSVALLALILMNGEILKSTAWESPDRVRLPCESNLMQHTLQSYLMACQHEFSVPNLRFQQTFVDHCRLKSPTITSRGLKTKGYLFELLPCERSGTRADQHCLCLNDSDRKALSDLGRGSVLRDTKLGKDAGIALSLLIQKLEALWPGSELASYMREHLSLDRNLSRSDPPQSALYVLDMMFALYQALRDDRELRLGRLASAPLNTEPAAIFIKPEPDGWRTEQVTHLNSDGAPCLTKVFTSWDQSHNSERLASLEVGVEPGMGLQEACGKGGCLLYSAGWVNGVWYAEGQSMGTYVFPLAGITEERHGVENIAGDGRRKRKRGDDI